MSSQISRPLLDSILSGSTIFFLHRLPTEYKPIFVAEKGIRWAALNLLSWCRCDFCLLMHQSTSSKCQLPFHWRLFTSELLLVAGKSLFAEVLHWNGFTGPLCFVILRSTLKSLSSFISSEFFQSNRTKRIQDLWMLFVCVCTHF